MSRKQDTAETAVQTVCGVLIGYGINLGIAPLIGIEMDMKAATSLTAMYVVASFVRSYLIRRGFRWWEQRA